MPISRSRPAGVFFENSGNPRENLLGVPPEGQSALVRWPAEPRRPSARALLETPERSTREAARYHTSNPQTAGGGNFRVLQEAPGQGNILHGRSEEHTSELQ